MLLIASFNYQDPPAGAIIAGAVVGLVLLACLGFFRSVLIGSLGGALSGAGIAWVVTGRGSGDLTGLMQVAGAIIFGTVGLTAGAIAGLVGKSLRGDSEHAGPGGAS